MITALKSQKETAAAKKKEESSSEESSSEEEEEDKKEKPKPAEKKVTIFSRLIFLLAVLRALSSVYDRIAVVRIALLPRATTRNANIVITA